MTHPHPPLARMLYATALVLAAMAPAAQAGERHMLPADMPQAYARECASCHVAYPPRLLPQASWQRIMSGLDRHYGVSAPIDAATVRQLDVWLQAHAGSGRRMREAPPEDRITRSAWFQREHRKVDAPVWKLPEVRSKANCTACHADAGHGDYDDDSLRTPAGLTLWQRRAWHD